MTNTMHEPAFRLEGRVIHKKPKQLSFEMGVTKVACGFPVCTVSEYADANDVMAILEANEAVTQQAQPVVDVSRFIEAAAKGKSVGKCSMCWTWCLGALERDCPEGRDVFWEEITIQDIAIAAMQHPAETKENRLDCRVSEAQIASMNLHAASVDAQNGGVSTAADKLIDELVGALEECANDLQAEVEHHYIVNDEVHPALQHKFDRDMEPVVKAYAALGSARKYREGK